MNSKIEKLYSKIFEQGFIHKLDADDLSQSLISLFEKEINLKEQQLNKLNKKKKSINKDFSSEEDQSEPF